ncbi:MAG TPA: hypothetical protein DC054_02990 [Blastocatellia bacterium]|nr:hypothetical protein [Blastocatellia bacterium]
MKNRILLLLAITMSAIGLVAMSGQTQRPTTPTKKEDATPQQEITERQRQHSKLYDKSIRSRKKLSDSPGDLQLNITAPWVEAVNDSPSTSTEEFLRTATCEAQAIVIGRVKNKTSMLTEDGRFVFTDYELQVEETLRDNRDAPIQPESVLIISRPGGAVELDGKTFRVTDDSFEPMEANGRYLLLLRFIPTTGAYQAINSHGSFELKDNKVHRLTTQPLPYLFSYEENAAAFVAQVHSAANKCRGAKVGGAN